MSKDLQEVIDNTISFTFQGETYVFDSSKVKLIDKVADDYVLNGTTEEFLLAFKRLKEVVEQVDIITRQELLRAFKEATSERTGSVTSEKTTISISETGTKYSMDYDKVDEVPSNMYKVKTTYSIDTKEVEKHLKEHGSLPLGIHRVANRNLSVSIRERKNMLLDAQENN
jgi:hypothetical protein